MPAGIRPTTDKVRKAVFDIIGHDLEGLSFLDLFAGSGSVGLEAISLGASHVLFVEKESRFAEVISENFSALNQKTPDRYSPFSQVVCSDAFFAIKQFHRKGEKFDIVFAAPPYGVDLAKKTLKTLEGYDILAPNSLIIIQHDKKEILPQVHGRICLVRERKYGGSYLSIFKVKNNE